MKISMQSWHYKLVEKVFKRPSKSLCVYFWQIPAAAVILFVAGAVTTILLLAILGGTLMILSLPLVINVVPMGYIEVILLGVMSLLIWVGVLTEFKKSFKDTSWNKTLFSFKEVEEDPAKKENLVFAYIKAKKEKICPTIEFDWS